MFLQLLHCWLRTVVMHSTIFLESTDAMVTAGARRAAPATTTTGGRGEAAAGCESWLCFDGASIPIVFWHAFFLYPFCIFLLFVLTRKHTTGTLSLYLDNTLLVLIPTYNFDNQSITYCSTYTTLPCM